MSLLVTLGMGALSVNNFQLTTTTPGLLQIVLTFNQVPILGGNALIPSNWTITGGSDGYNPLVTSVSVLGMTVVLVTQEQKNGHSYTLHVPDGIISSLGDSYSGPFSIVFTGVGNAPNILIVQVITSTSIDLVYNEPVNVLDALNINNYSVDNGLQILAAEERSTSIFRLTTSNQTHGTNYEITVSNVRDLAGNVI